MSDLGRLLDSNNCNHNDGETPQPPKYKRGRSGADPRVLATAHPHPLSAPRPPSQRGVVTPTGPVLRLRDQFFALLMWTHPRCGGPCRRLGGSVHGCGYACVDWIDSSMPLCFTNNLTTFGVSPLTGAITREVTFWRDNRPNTRLLSVNSHNALSFHRLSDRLELAGVTTGTKLVVWEGLTVTQKARKTEVNGKWLLVYYGILSKLEVTPTFGDEAGTRCVIDDVPLVMPASYRMSDINIVFFFNHAVQDEAVIVQLGNGAKNLRPYMAHLMVIDTSQTWSRKRVSILSSTTSAFNVWPCEVPSGVVLRNQHGSRFFVVVLDMYQAGGRCAIAIEEGTGTQIQVKGDGYVDGICPLSGSLFCIARHHMDASMVPLLMFSGPTWYEIWDCNNLHSALRNIGCPVGCTSVFAEGGLIITTVIRESGNCCLQITEPSSGNTLFSFSYTGNIQLQSLFSQVV
ncbi:hypothetical protein Pelo_9882 [Pelomyxa schiedti]|nr:hypothetical protein Pelo_9882 [Pelomyxa schiedti]